MLHIDRISAGQHLESIVAEVDLKNGQLIFINDLVEGSYGKDRELFQAVLATEERALHEHVLLHATPELQRDERSVLDDFYLKAGERGRAYHLQRGNTWTITSDLLVDDYATIQEGDYLVPADNGLYKKVDDVTTYTGLVVFKVLRKEQIRTNFNFEPAVKIQVHRA